MGTRGNGREKEGNSWRKATPRRNGSDGAKAAVRETYAHIARSLSNGASDERGPSAGRTCCEAKLDRHSVRAFHIEAARVMRSARSADHDLEGVPAIAAVDCAQAPLGSGQVPRGQGVHPDHPEVARCASDARGSKRGEDCEDGYAQHVTSIARLNSARGMALWSAPARAYARKAKAAVSASRTAAPCAPCAGRPSCARPALRPASGSPAA
jgi:hypothetical protein